MDIALNRKYSRQYSRILTKRKYLRIYSRKYSRYMPKSQIYSRQYSREYSRFVPEIVNIHVNISVLTVAEQFAIKRCKRISRVSRNIGRPYCAFTMDLHCDVIYFREVGTGRFACLFVCLRLAAL